MGKISINHYLSNKNDTKEKILTSQLEIVIYDNGDHFPNNIQLL